jgi:hypothetical protein
MVHIAIIRDDISISEENGRDFGDCTRRSCKCRDLVAWTLDKDTEGKNHDLHLADVENAKSRSIMKE